MKKVWKGGLLALLVVVLVSTGCRGSYQQPPPEPPPDDNICGWPDYCHPHTARHMLTEIRLRAEADVAKDAIDPQDLETIHQEVEESLDPLLKNTAGRHVCHLTLPKPCAELLQIYKMLEDMPTKPAARKGRWHTIAQELQSFPSGK